MTLWIIIRTWIKKYVFLYLFSGTLPYRGEMRLCVIYSIPLSMIRDHCEFSDPRMRVSNFSVVACSESWNLRTLESIYILNNKPLLNIDQSATPLYIL